MLVGDQSTALSGQGAAAARRPVFRAYERAGPSPGGKGGSPGAPSVDPFLEKLGLPTRTVIGAPLFAELPIPPGAVAACQAAFADYLANPDDAKAFAVSTHGHCGTGFGRTSVEAREPALMKCKINSRGEDCRLYAVGQKLSVD